jgi:hypothetical protein
MRKRLLGSLAALVGLLAAGALSPIWAMRIMAPPVGQRVATADYVLVGTVKNLEPNEVEVAAVPGQPQKTRYRIAIVTVEDPILGVAKGTKTVRVGFVPPPNPGAQKPGGGIRPPIKRFPTVELKKGQKAVLLLTKHQEGKFFVAPAYFDVINAENNPNFGKEVEEIKKSVKLLENPKAGLKSKDADEQLLTASLLVAKYRSYRPGVAKTKTEPIDAEQSRLILNVLSTADWNKKIVFGQPNPLALFNQLGLTAKEGWTPPQVAPGQNYAQVMEAAAKMWLQGNAGTYRIQRIVPDTSAQK